jgi:hypothetical protein
MDEFERYLQELIEKTPDRFQEPGNPLDHCEDLPTNRKEMLQAYREGRLDDVAAYALSLELGDPLKLWAESERRATLKKATRISKENREKNARDRKREALEKLAEMPSFTTLKYAANKIHRDWTEEAEFSEHSGEPASFVPKPETIRAYLKGARRGS